MKRILPRHLTFLLLILFVLVTSAAAQIADSNVADASDKDDDAPVARVARLSFVEGDVSFLRAGVTEWAPVVENLPLLAGDQVYAGRGARAEIQLGRGEYIRLSENTELTINRFSDNEALFEVTEGTAIIRIERLSSAFHLFELDTPNTAVAFKQDGIYRVDVRGEDNSELIVQRGEAEASSDEGSFKVRDGHRLIIDTTAGGKLELVADATQDEWDRWSHDRDLAIDRAGSSLSPDYVASYETTYNDFYGASDLSSYGTWTSYPAYGQCWLPRVGSDWAPYRQGQWLWIPSTGWTWLSSEPWGWAPYHYGRWAYLSGIGWAWIPGFGSPYRGYGYGDYRWRPALVYFFNGPTSRGRYIGWYPLAPGEHWHRSDRDWRRDDRRHDRKPGLAGQPMPVDGGGRIRPPKNRGVTILPAESFAGSESRLRPAVQGKDLSDWISKGAQAGLPDMKPTPAFAAPAIGDGNRKRLRRIAVPPAEVANRPVVTRNADDSSYQLGAKRERRLISGRDGNTRETPAMTEAGADRSVERKLNRHPQQSTPEQFSHGAAVHDHKPKANGSATSSQAGESENNNKQEKRRNRFAPPPAVTQQGTDSRALKHAERRQADTAAAPQKEAAHSHHNAENHERARQEQPSPKEQRKEQQQLEQRKKN
jgi:hypothetical protein